MLAAISRLPSPAAFNRRASLILRMESLFLGTRPPPRAVAGSQEGCEPLVVDEASPGTVSAFVRIVCPESAVLRVRIHPFWVSRFNRFAHHRQLRERWSRQQGR